MAGHQDDITFLLQIGDGGTTDVDVTDHVQSFRTRKGRDRETDSYQPASATLTLLDTDRRFDPNNTSGPYAGGLTPLRRVRAQLDSANLENYLDYANGHIAAVDSVALSVTGDIDVRWFGTLTDWDNAAAQVTFNKWEQFGVDERSWMIRFESTGVRFYISTDGTAATEVASTAVAVPFADNEYGGVRFTRVQSSGLTTVYFSDDDGETWEASATTTVLAAGSALFDSTGVLRVAGHSLVDEPIGKALRAELWNGIEGSGGTLVASPNFTTLAAGRHLFYEPLVDGQGNTWNGFGADVVVSAGSRLFTGYVNDWAVDYYDGDRTAIITVTCTDALGVLANCELDTIAAAHSGDTSGVRVQRVLDLAEVAFTDAVSIDAGKSTFGATTLGGNALDYLQQCAKAEGGYLFVDRNGTFQFMDRHSLLNDSTTALAFADAHAGSGIPYRRLSQSSSADLLYNRATGAGTSGTEQSASVAASQIRTLAVGELLLSSDAAVLSLLEWLVQRFKDPEARFSAIELNTMSLSAADAESVALLDLATLVSVSRLPLGGEPYDPFVLDGGGYTLEDLTLLDLDGGGYVEAT